MAERSSVKAHLTTTPIERMQKTIGLLLAIFVCGLETGCTGIDGESIEIVSAQQDISSETNFEKLLTDELESVLTKMEFACNPQQRYLHKEAILYCYGPLENSFGGYQSRRDSVFVYKKSEALPNSTVNVETTYGTIFPWMPSAHGFRKLSSKVHTVIDRAKGNRKLISRYTGGRYQGQPGKSPLP